MDNTEMSELKGEPDGITFDSHRLAQIGRSIVGEQTIQVFCNQSGISRSLVSRILNGTLKSPPRISSIYRFAGGDTKVADEMLLACGYPPGTIAHMKERPALLSKAELDSPIVYAPYLAANPAACLALILNLLGRMDYGDRYQTDYRLDGTFAIELGHDHKLIGIPAFSTDDSDPDSVLRTALRKFALTLPRWDSSHAVYFLVTNTQQMFSKLKATPNIDFKLAVLLTTDGQNIASQHVIAPYGASKEEQDATVRDFPVRFVD